MIVDVLRSTRFTYGNEDQLQEGIAEVLSRAGFDVQREVRLDAHSRIDMLVNGHIGVEVKVAGRLQSVLAQLRRYAKDPRVDELVLVTSRATHRPPAAIDGKPVHLVNLAGSRL